MSGLQFYILVATSLVGVLHLSATMNTAFAGFESKMETGFDRLDARFDKLMGKSMEIDSPASRTE